MDQVVIYKANWLPLDELEADSKTGGLSWIQMSAPLLDEMSSEL